MVLLSCEALLGLVFYDIVIRVRGLSAMLLCVRHSKLAAHTANPEIIKHVGSAIETAYIWYPRKALCLQRSAVTTYLLRRRGIPAHLVIGTKVMPLLAHAWVEVDGAVVNDWPRVQQAFVRIAQY
jgi:hypothetical protein